MVTLLLTPLAFHLTSWPPSYFRVHASFAQLLFLEFLTIQIIATSGPSTQVLPLPRNLPRVTKLLVISLTMNVFSDT